SRGGSSLPPSGSRVLTSAQPCSPRLTHSPPNSAASPVTFPPPPARHSSGTSSHPPSRTIPAGAGQFLQVRLVPLRSGAPIAAATGAVKATPGPVRSPPVPHAHDNDVTLLSLQRQRCDSVVVAGGPEAGFGALAPQETDMFLLTLQRCGAAAPGVLSRPA